MWWIRQGVVPDNRLAFEYVERYAIRYPSRAEISSTACRSGPSSRRTTDSTDAFQTVRWMAPDAEVAFEETFGPVAILEVADDVADAVRRANSSRYGLTAGILTGDPFRGMELARQLESGIVHVNDQPVNDQPQMPFGGVKHSGYGRFGLGFVAEEFTELQWVTARADRRTFPF
jgi:hypothetical protein